MDDAALVDAARAGDREAWGVIYDRYADRLHDHCWSILRDEHEAADALHDAFVNAARSLSQLRDPARLRPWLYAIARNESFRRHRLRARVVPSEELGEVGSVSFEVDADSVPPVEDLRRLVWDAAGGLSEDDKALLDLHLRQGLEGEELAEALGITPNNAYVKLSRLRDTLERSLGALLVARTGRKDCPELAALMAGWDGELSPLLRKRIARHIDGCEICGDRKKAMVSPLALLAGVPLVAAPATLRDRILDDAVLAASSAPAAADAMFPIPDPPPMPAAASGRGSRGGWIAGSAAAAVLVVAALLFALWGNGDDDDLATVDSTTSTTAAPTVTTASTTTSSSTTSSTTSTTAPAVVAPPALTLSVSTIDLGDVNSSGSFQVQNTGGTALTFVVTTSNARLTVEPPTRTLQPGDARTVFVTLDRDVGPEGPFSHQVTVQTAETGQHPVTVTGTILRPPVIVTVDADPPTISVCATDTTSPHASTITARFTDQSDASAVLFFDGPPAAPTGPRRTGSTPMTPTADGATATVDPTDGIGGTMEYWVVVTDALGSSTESTHRQLELTPCPG